MLSLLLITTKIAVLCIIGLPVLAIAFFVVGITRTESVSRIAASHVAKNSVWRAAIAVLALSVILLFFHFIILQSIV